MHSGLLPTFNAVKAAAAAGKTLPPGLVADADGNETTDPTKAEQLLPIGDYKGFGLSMMVDILCAVLSGMPNGNNVSKMFGDPMSKKRELGVTSRMILFPRGAIFCGVHANC